MIPRPIYKIVVLPLWGLLAILLFWSWWHFSSPLKTYYLGPTSRFEYERLFLPAFPRLPGQKIVAAHSDLVGYRCGAGFCLAGPADWAVKKRLVHFMQYAPDTVVQREIAQRVYGGSLLGALWLPINGSIALFAVLIPAAVLLDYRRRKRILKGVQIQGRWPVSPEGFGNWLSRWRKNTVVIPVRIPSDQNAPL